MVESLKNVIKSTFKKGAEEEDKTSVQLPRDSKSSIAVTVMNV